MKHRVAKPENNIEITYTCSGKAEYAPAEEFTGTKLPFEMFFSVEEGEGESNQVRILLSLAALLESNDSMQNQPKETQKNECRRADLH